MADSTDTDRSQLFMALVLGDEGFLKTLPPETDFNKKFTFKVSGFCLCGVKFERFLGSQENMMAEFEEAVKAGQCLHCPGGSKAPADDAEKMDFVESIMQEEIWNVELYVGSCLTGKPKKAVDVGVNPLHLTILLNHTHLVTWLLDESRTNIEASTERLKEPPLNLAVYADNKEMVSLLLSRGAKIKTKADGSHDTPAVLAIQNNNHDMLEYLIEHGADINELGGFSESPISLAVTENKLKCVEVLVNAGVDTRLTPQQDETVLNYAVQRDIEMVKILLRGNIDVNEIGSEDSKYPPLITAISTGRLDVAKLLLEHGATPNALMNDDHHILHIAAYTNRPEAVDLLLQFGADVNALNNHQYSALHHASWDGHISICRKLLAAGADFDGQTKDKNTPLSLACHGNRKEVVQMFLTEYNCNVNNQDKDLDTALHYTSFNGCLESTKWLIAKGGNPAAENAAGSSPIWNAIYNKHHEIISFLLEKNVPLDIASRGIDQHAQSNDVTYIYDTPKSPLYVAVERELLELPRMLVLSGLTLSKERWLYSGNLPSNLQVQDVNNGNDMIGELNKVSHQVLSLKDSARCNIRRLLKLDLPQRVNSFELPHTLVSYLMCKDW